MTRVPIQAIALAIVLVWPRGAVAQDPPSPGLRQGHAAALRAEADWPDFRGPGGQGHADTSAEIPLEWNESRNLVWKTPIAGQGWSTPIVHGGKIWLTSAVEDRGISLRALAYDVVTGREVVNVEVFRTRSAGARHPKNSYASPSALADGNRIYVHFGALGTAALSMDGAILWKREFRYESQHGGGGSPVLHGDLLIFNCDGSDEAFVVALDTQTGKTRWKTSRRSPWSQAYTTPLIIRVGDRDQLISVGAFRTTAYDPTSGRELWRVTYGEGFSNVPRPVFSHGLVYIATGFFQPAILAVRPDGSGDVTKTHVSWALTRAAPLTPSPVIVGDELYLVTDTGVASCVDAKTGQIVWQQRLNGNFSASPVATRDRIYFLSEEGVTTVIAPGRAFRQLASNRIDGSTLASMAVSGDSVFLRSSTHLYRIGSRK